jgi:hypothetical protein
MAEEFNLSTILGLPEENLTETESTSINTSTLTMTEDEIVNFVVECFTKSQEARLPKEELWLQSIEQYNLIHDYSAKEEWQAKILIPKIFDAVEHIVTFVESGIFGFPEYYKIEKVKGTIKPSLIKELVDIHLKKSKFQNELSKAIRYCLLTGYGTLKIIHTLNFDNPLDIECVSSFDIYLDPSQKNRFIIHRLKKSIDELYETQPYMNYINLDKLTEFQTKTYEEAKEKLARGEITEDQMPNVKEVELLEFWGNIYNKEGRLIYKQIVCTVANRHILIRAPEDFSPFFSDLPFVIFYVIPGLNTVYPPPFIGNLCNLARYINETLSLMFDACAYASIPLFRINPHAIFNSEILMEGLYPGQVVQGLENAIEPVRIGQGITQDILAMYNIFKAEFQEASSVTEYLTGRAPTKSRQTAKEIIAKREQGAMFFNKFARSIETYLLEPLILKLYDAIRRIIINNEITIYDDILRKYGIVFATPTSELKEQILPGEFDLKVYGLSLLTTQQEKIDKLLAFMNLISKMGAIEEIIDMRKVVAKFAELLGIYPYDIFKDEVIKEFLKIEEETKEETYAEKKSGEITET